MWETILGIIGGLGLLALLARIFLEHMAAARSERADKIDPGDEQ